MNESVLSVDVQIADDLENNLKNSLPSNEAIDQWLTTSFTYLSARANNTNNARSELGKIKLNPELSIRVVSSAESQTLNSQYRQKDSPTNVLSFESDLPDFIPSGFIGDLVICARVVKDEAQQQNKRLHDHWAHMCIHGALHLLGYDHIADDDAIQMETIEIEILAELGIDDPYQIS